MTTVRAPGRRGTVLAALALAVTVLVTAGLSWAGGEVPTVLGPERVSVTGMTAAPAVLAGAGVAAAAALTAGIGRRMAVTVAGAALLLAAAAVGYGVAAFLGAPAGSLLDAAAEVSGVRELAGPVAITPGPYLTGALAVGLAAAGLIVLVAGRSWPQPGRRFERGDTGPPADRGPSAHSGPSAPADPLAPGAPPVQAVPPVDSARSGGPTQTDPRTRAMDDWDALGRGEDPSDRS